MPRITIHPNFEVIWAYTSRDSKVFLSGKMLIGQSSEDGKLITDTEILMVSFQAKRARRSSSSLKAGSYRFLAIAKNIATHVKTIRNALKCITQVFKFLRKI